MTTTNSATTVPELATLWSFHCRRTKFGICRDHPTDVENAMQAMVDIGFTISELHAAIMARRDKFEQLWEFRDRLKRQKFGKAGMTGQTMADMLAQRRGQKHD